MSAVVWCDWCGEFMDGPFNLANLELATHIVDKHADRPRGVDRPYKSLWRVLEKRGWTPPAAKREA